VISTGRRHATARLRSRLHEAEQTLRAIRSGGVDALVVAGQEGPRVFTLEGAEHTYRRLIESMHEGALMLSAHGLILYSNQRFARMIKRPLARVTGSSFHRFLSEADQEALRPLLKRAAKPISTIQVFLRATDSLQIPAQISVHRLGRNGSSSAAFSVVVTDMTEVRRRETMLRGLSHSLLQAQEADRRRLAVELHDRASQNLGALLLRLQVLAGNLPPRARALRREVAVISKMVGRTADVVEGISRNLRPSVLEILGLLPALRAAIAEFVKRTGMAVKLDCAQALAPLPAEVELVLYRVLEEALKNVEQHAKAGHATVRLRQRGAVVELMIKDDGVGFNSNRAPARTKKRHGMGLVGLRERAAYVGGTLRITSTRGAGAEIEARIRLAGGAAARPLDQ
jgi:two-component system, NarL family, sensor kinase